jgi:Pyruvate/2-oxoacid:ferredoxin oxidoreductase gamma subunit
MAWHTRSSGCWRAATTSFRRPIRPYTRAVPVAQEAVANWNHPLLRADGTALLSAHEALLKGALESELEIDAIYAPRRVPFEPIFTLMADPAVQRALSSHRLRVEDAVDAARAVSLAARAASEGRRAIALVPNEQLALGLAALGRTERRAIPEGGSLILLLEDNPYLVPLACPWSAARGLQVPVLGPRDITALRDGIEHAARLAHAGSRMSAIVAHSLVLRSLDSPTLRPNRVLERIDQAAAILRARRGGKSAETGDVLRVVRRLELNRVNALPSPGEREPVAFIAVGPASIAIHHILGEFGLEGRVPVLDLGCTQPLDDSLLERLLLRCEDAVVLEPRPGGVALQVLDRAEDLRRRGEHPGRLWWRSLPPQPEGERPTLEINDGVRPSILLRKVMHLLQSVRPGLQHSPRLAVALPELQGIRTPRRAFGLGPTGAIDSVRSILDDAAALVAQPDPDNPDAPTRMLAPEGVPAQGADRVTAVEVWERRQFAVEGAAAIQQASHVDAPRLFIVVDLGGSDDVDVERLANAAVPVTEAARLHVAHADLNDRPGLASVMAQTARLDGVGVVVAHDGPPARRDIRQLEASVAEADRLGFTAQQRLIWPADVGCEVRPLPQAVLLEKGAERGLDPLQTEFVKEALPAEEGLPLRLEIRALLEQIEVVRTRPPLLRFDGEARIKPPRAVHGREGRWRCHVAGYRGDPPGIVALALSEAGRAMGYRVQAIYHPTPVGPGRRAWAQVLYTSFDDAPDARVHAPQTPYGEADLLLGFDAVETLRAIGPDPYLRVASPDRTYVVANTGAFEDQVVPELAEAAARLPRTLPLATRADGALLADLVTTCRRAFLTDRVADLVALGAAFQRGFVPVSVEAMEGAMRRLERRGFGRSLEAFEFGRRLAEGQVLPDADSARGDSLGRLVRRSALELEASRFGGGRRARQFREIVRDMIDAMPALYMTAEGRQALRDFVNASVRCVAWGGIRHLRWYAGTVRQLYDAGQADPERRLCTMGILPLAELTLVRDALYVAAMQAATSHARRIRERLGVRANRGDHMMRRYLNRVEVVLGRTMYRLDLRSSDWPAQLALLLWRIVPNELRGQPSDRRIRSLATELFERAIAEPERYPHWCEVAAQLNEAAARHTLHEMSASELEALGRS